MIPTSQLLFQVMIDELSRLVLSCPGIKLKVETESEGAFFSDISKLNCIGSLSKVELAVKIAGVEALRDLYEISQLQISYFIAPMVETVFACSKFTSSLQKLSKKYDGYILVESITGIRNFKSICDYAASNGISGVIIGRTDLAQSLRIQEGIDVDVESTQVTELVIEALDFAKTHYPSLVRAMGGSISQKTLSLVSKHFLGLVDYFETRKVVIPLNLLAKDNSILNLALSFELSYLKQRVGYYDKLLEADKLRLIQLATRI